MIQLDEVREQILQRIQPLESEMVPLMDAFDRTLAAPIPSQDAIPPFDNTAMDGFVVRAADTVNATQQQPVSLPVVATIEAGNRGDEPLEAGRAMRIYTGAVIPPGGDAIVPFERCQQPDRSTVVIEYHVTDGAHIRRCGEDVAAGESVLDRGTRLTPAAIGLLASVGAQDVPVFRRPRVAIHSSGNELVPIESTLQPGQIRNSNQYSLAARIARWGAIPILRPVLRDDREQIREGLQDTLDLKPDAIVTTGGISAGDLDHIRDIAREMGDEIEIRKVSMKPGKPLVDGIIDGVPFFGLPGNPAAALVSFEVFVRPALAKLESRNDGILPQRCGVLMAERDLLAGDRLRLLRGRAIPDPEGGPDHIEIATGQGSHLLAGFARANCLIQIPASTEVLHPGDRVNYWSLTDEEA